MTAQVYMLTAGADEINRVTRAGYRVEPSKDPRYACRAEIMVIRGEEAKRILTAMPFGG